MDSAEKSRFELLPLLTMSVPGSFCDMRIVRVVWSSLSMPVIKVVFVSLTVPAAAS